MSSDPPRWTVVKKGATLHFHLWHDLLDEVMSLERRSYAFYEWQERRGELVPVVQRKRKATDDDDPDTFPVPSLESHRVFLGMRMPVRLTDEEREALEGLVREKSTNLRELPPRHKGGAPVLTGHVVADSPFQAALYAALEVWRKTGVMMTTTHVEKTSEWAGDEHGQQVAADLLLHLMYRAKGHGISLWHVIDFLEAVARSPRGKEQWPHKEGSDQ